MRNRNNGGGISYNQYKLFDIILFLVMMAALEAVNVFAVKKWFPDMLFTVSLMFTVSLIALVRWNWLAAIFPVLDGILYCAFLGAPFNTYVIYSVGNAFLLLSWFIFKLLPKEKLFGKWYLTIIYPAVAYVLVVFGRTAVAACFGNNFVDALLAHTGYESLNIVFATVALLIVRRVEGILVDQKKYLLRLYNERMNAKPNDGDYWEGYTELDEEELRKLRGYDSLLPRDDPPEGND